MQACSRAHGKGGPRAVGGGGGRGCGGGFGGGGGGGRRTGVARALATRWRGAVGRRAVCPWQSARFPSPP
eukprot:4148331-Pleurochrysis_carterae.AAC.4